MKKLILDTTVANIFSQKNRKQIDSGTETIFNAGKIGIKMKNGLYESDRCSDLLRLGYTFSPMACETLGGITPVLKHIISFAMDTKCNSMIIGNKTKKNKASILKNNFWIRFGIRFAKCVTTMIQDKYMI